MFFGENPESAALLISLGLKREDFGEYLDSWVLNGRIGIFTRDGGEQRSARSSVFALVRQHPSYLEDRDDFPHRDYCTYYFQVPETHRLWLDTLIQAERGSALLVPLLTAVRMEAIS